MPRNEAGMGAVVAEAEKKEKRAPEDSSRDSYLGQTGDLREQVTAVFLSDIQS